MEIIIALLLVVVVIIVAVSVLAATLALLWYLVVGLVIGAIARALVPGTSGMGLVSTTLYGIVGSFVGGIIGEELLDLGRLASFPLAVVTAAAAIVLVRGVRR